MLIMILTQKIYWHLNFQRSFCCRQQTERKKEQNWYYFCTFPKQSRKKALNSFSMLGLIASIKTLIKITKYFTVLVLRNQHYNFVPN